MKVRYKSKKVDSSEDDRNLLYLNKVMTSLPPLRDV